MESEKIAIGIVDDHTLFRAGVAGLLTEYQEVEVVFQAANGEQLQQLLLKSSIRPKVILMDINMPIMNGYETTKWLKIHYPEIKVLALTMFEDDQTVIKMIKAGAVGYMLKESKPRELLEAIKITIQKGMFLNDMVSGSMIRSLTKEDAQILSSKEVEFLKLCCSELTYKEIADQMFVSPRTVDNYRESLFEKLSIKSRTGLVLYAIKNGIYQV